MNGFTSTHVAPEGGLNAWAEPDGAQPAVATIDPGVEMAVLERQGDWAHIACANGWSAWVDGRLLASDAAASREIPGRESTGEVHLSVPAMAGAVSGGAAAGLSLRAL